MGGFSVDTQTKEYIANDYINGMKLTDIFKKYHTSYKTVVKILDERGIGHSRSKIPGTPNIKNQRILSLEEENLVCETYKKTGRITDCCKAIASGQEVVRRCLMKYNLYQTHSEAMKRLPQNQRKYPVKDDYFNVENSEMAYILGLLAADGSVSKKENEIKLSFSSIDKDFLIMLQEKIGGRPIKSYITQDGFEVSSWCFTSKAIKDKLAFYNIVPEKTFVFTFPKHLCKDYWKDFIRGYFDGDGSISTAGPSAIRFQICSATKDVLEVIIDYFEEYGIKKPNIQIKQGKNPIYYFQYSSVPTRKIYDILYYENCLCLPRKARKYKELLYRNLKK